MSYEIYHDDLFVDVTDLENFEYSKKLGNSEVKVPVFYFTLS
jgi:hypothetical protein